MRYMYIKKKQSRSGPIASHRQWWCLRQTNGSTMRRHTLSKDMQLQLKRAVLIWIANIFLCSVVERWAGNASEDLLSADHGAQFHAVCASAPLADSHVNLSSSGILELPCFTVKISTFFLLLLSFYFFIGGTVQQQQQQQVLLHIK